MATKGVTVDETFLKNFLARGGQAVTPTGGQVDNQNVDEFLKQRTARAAAAQDSTTSKKIDAATRDDRAAILHEKAEQARIRTASDQEKAERARAEAETREQELQRQATQKQVSAARAAVDAALVPAKSAADRLASVRTTGGIALLLGIIGVLLFAVVQINSEGDTRMKQLWYMLNGRATLQGRVAVTGATADSQTVTQDIQDLGNAVGQFVGDLGSDVTSAMGNIPVYGGIFSGIGTVLDEFRNLP